jgi:phosphate:Na+ symporter
MHLILGLLSAVALLAFGVALTKKYMLRLFGSSISRVIGKSVGSTPKAFITGVLVTMLLQSSTATSFLVSGFMKQGLLALGTALTIMLGADLGTAIMARVLTYDLSMICPLLMLAGTVCFLGYSERPKVKHTGGILIGLGLILLSLSLIVSTTRPALDSDITALLLKSLAGQMAFSVILGMGIAVLCVSSLAAVLLTSLMCSTGAISPECSMALVLGANMGSCVLELMGASRQGPEARRVMTGNTLFRVIIASAALAAMPLLVKLQQRTLPLSEFVIWFHVGFNFCVCAVMLPFVNLFSKLLYALIPDERTEPSEDAPRHLDRSAYVDPNLALGDATREILRIGDCAIKMLSNLTLESEGKTPQGEGCQILRKRIGALVPEISAYLSGIACDSHFQRSRSAQCTLACARISQLAGILSSLEKKILSLRSLEPMPGGRLECANALCASLMRTMEYAMNAFASPSPTAAQHSSFVKSLSEFRSLVDGASSKQVSQDSQSEAAAPGRMLMLELIGQFRQCSMLLSVSMPQEEPAH